MGDETRRIVVKRTTALFLACAKENQEEARTIVGVNLAKPAARSAYYAASHAAEVWVLARNGRWAKTHSGVRNAFHQVAHGDPRIPQELPDFLSNAYNFKEIADNVGEVDKDVTREQAETAVRQAKKLVDRISELLMSDPPDALLDLSGNSREE